MVNQQMFTRWGRNLDREKVLQEYPRPAMVRNSYLNLNGTWEYAITKSEEMPDLYGGEILVPFSPEAPLSGVNRQLQPDEVLHYRKSVKLEKVFLKGRCLLHFGAVDQYCEVFVNGSKAGSHLGGYLAFAIDVTAFVHSGENRIQVIVRDDSDTSWHARGKQKLERGGMWYTAQSGIWQTVWMECVPDRYITELKIVPLYDEGMIQIRVFTNQQEQTTVKTVISYKGKKKKEISFQSNQTVRCSLEHFFSWTPETPEIYDCEITMGEDCVNSYFAMRKYSVGKDAKGILRFQLNNQCYYQNGVLDQGYFPDGLYTAPSDEALKSDILVMKSLGFNMLRKHMKIEPARWYYHCDRIGMLVWQDMICGGEDYHMPFVCTMPNAVMWTGRKIRDNKYRLFARSSVEGHKEYYRELKEMIRQLYHYPSIAAWVPFNEGWGQFDAAKATALVRKIDPNRLIDEASGWFDQGGGDMYSIHNYWRKLRVHPEKDRVVALTECGGYSWQMKEHSFGEEVYGYRIYHSRQQLTEGICRLWKKELLPNIPRGLSASVYTQVSDVEDEVNGLLSYDRACLKIDPKQMREVNQLMKDTRF